jgi:hypothetical protein
VRSMDSKQKDFNQRGQSCYNVPIEPKRKPMNVYEGDEGSQRDSNGELVEQNIAGEDPAQRQ